MANGRARHMSTPPPAGWPPGPPPDPRQPFGQQGFNPQQPAGWQQGQWPQQPSPPPQKGSGLKWLLIAVAVLLVVAISVGATLIFTRDSGGGGGTTPSSSVASEFASAGDTGPVAIITDEPTCATWIGINNSMGDVQKQGWSDTRQALGPVDEWTAEQRGQVNAVAAAMRSAADQAVAMSKRTPHRVIRELYEQFIVYSRSYADSVANYTPIDDGLASVSVNSSSAIIGICNTITFGSTGRAMAAKPATAPTDPARPADSKNITKFVTSSTSECSEWVSTLDALTAQTGEWDSLDPNVPASQWTPDRIAIENSAASLLSSYAVDIVDIGMRSKNPVFEDFSSAASIYIATYNTAGNSYTSADSWLSYVGFRFANLISGACRAISS